MCKCYINILYSVGLSLDHYNHEKGKFGLSQSSQFTMPPQCNKILASAALLQKKRIKKKRKKTENMTEQCLWC